MAVTINLSEKQKQIVYAGDGPIYVRASAGSGKTRVLTERVRFLLNNSRKKVLALTFTNKAGEEIKERLSDIPEIEKRTFIGTFHGFCQHLLENHGNLIGFSKMPHIFEDESDRMELVSQAIRQTPSCAIEYKKQSDRQKKDFRYRVLSFISEVKRKLLAENEIYKYTNDENLILLYQNYQDIMHSQNAIDFDDLLLFAHSLLNNFPKTAALYRRSFCAICVDEAQDLNNAQYQILLALSCNEFTNIMMVGDPNQSIYYFNGSSPEYMDKMFVHSFRPAVYELNENFRSSRAVLSAAKKIVPDSESIKDTVKKGIFDLLSFQDEKEESQWVVNKIIELLNQRMHDDIEGDITSDKIVILARNRYIFQPLEDRLCENMIKFSYKMNPGAIQFESDLMKIFDLALRVRLNPQDVLHRQRLTTRLNTNYVDSLGLDDIVFQISDGLNKNILKTVMMLNDDGSNIRTVLEKFRNNLLEVDENDRFMIYNDIGELLSHWRNYAKKTDTKSLHQFKNAMALGQTHSLTQQDGITLSTVHTMKGQEYDIVFLVGMDDETFPDYRAVRSGGVEMAQEKNNLYVAFTRAKRFLYVTWPQNRMMPWGDFKSRKISRFLKDF